MRGDRPGPLGSTARCALQFEIVGGEPSETKQQNESNDCLRDGAVETPDSEAVLLDHGEAKREEESDEGGEKGSELPASETEVKQKQIAGDADGGDGDVVHDRK